MLILLLFFVSVFAHPFENNLVGHQLSVEIQEEQVFINYDLELPTPGVQSEYSSFEKKNGEDKKPEFIQGIYKEILSNLQLQINEEVVSPAQISHKKVETRNKGKFMVFSSQISYPITENLQSISIVNQNRIIDPAIYKNEVLVSQKWTVADTDMIIWKEKNPHSSLMKEWMVEDRLREVRISFFGNNWWSKWKKYWNEEILQEEKSIDLWSHLKRQNQTWLNDWKQGRTSLFSFLVLAFGSVFLSLFKMPIRKWEILVCCVMPFLLWVVPLSWDTSIYLTYMFLCSGIILGVFRQELAFSFWLWSFLILWVYPKYLALILGLPIFIFATKGRKIGVNVSSVLLLVLLIMFYLLTKN